MCRRRATWTTDHTDFTDGNCHKKARRSTKRLSIERTTENELVAVFAARDVARDDGGGSDSDADDSELATRTEFVFSTIRSNKIS